MELLNGNFYFAGWIPSVDDPNTSEDEFLQQGLWITSSSTPDGSAPGDFEDWSPLLFDHNGPSWRPCNIDPNSCNQVDGNRCRCHQDGLIGATLKKEGNKYWLFYSYKEHLTAAHIGRAEITDSSFFE